MGDEMDGCECVWSHEVAMQRLLQFIRQSQSHCTDTECFDVSGRTVQPGVSTGGEEGNFTMMIMLMMLAVIMYFIRPESVLKLTQTKRPNNDNGNGGPSPPPSSAPPAVN